MRVRIPAAAATASEVLPAHVVGTPLVQALLHVYGGAPVHPHGQYFAVMPKDPLVAVNWAPLLAAYQLVPFAFVALATDESGTDRTILFVPSGLDDSKVDRHRRLADQFPRKEFTLTVSGMEYDGILRQFKIVSAELLLQLNLEQYAARKLYLPRQLERHEDNT